MRIGTDPMLIIFPSEPYSLSRIEPDFEEQYQAAKSAGFEVALIDIDEWKVKLGGYEGPALYRGWMLTIEQYQRLHRLLAERAVDLLTNPEQYRTCHELPGWYRDFQEVTPRSVWFKGFNYDLNTIEEVLGHGPAIIKDYVKSAKHYWEEACFVPSLEDGENVRKVTGRFLELQGEFLNGGLVYRQFKKFRELGSHQKSGMPLTLEYRLFFFRSRLLCWSGYWEETAYSELRLPVEKFESLAKRVENPFFTMDVACDEEGEWWVVELGDAQVSGFQGVKAGDFYKALAKAANIIESKQSEAD